MLARFSILPNCKITKTNNALIIAITYSPTPTLRPIAATIQSVAALVIPLMCPLCAIILPAPKKPIPVTIPAAILEGSMSNERDITVKIVDGAFGNDADEKKAGAK